MYVLITGLKTNRQGGHLVMEYYHDHCKSTELRNQNDNDHEGRINLNLLVQVWYLNDDIDSVARQIGNHSDNLEEGEART